MSAPKGEAGTGSGPAAGEDLPPGKMEFALLYILSIDKYYKFN